MHSRLCNLGFAIWAMLSRLCNLGYAIQAMQEAMQSNVLEPFGSVLSTGASREAPVDNECFSIGY